MMTSITGRSSKTAVQNSGFTLLELIAAMLVIATVLAMAAPSLRGFFASRQTNDVARYLLAMTRYARSQAIAQGQTWCLEIDVGAGRCQLHVVASGENLEIEDHFGKPYYLPEGVALSVEDVGLAAGTVEILFKPNGLCTPATLVIAGRQDDTYRVHSQSATELYAMVQEVEP